MATESPLLHDGSQTVSGVDCRNGTITGTTHLGPNGSYQFMAFRLSTVTDRTVNPCTANGQEAYGILQNKPSTGEAADIGILGISKMVAGSTFGPGIDLMTDSSGALIPYSSAAGVNRVGRSLETVSAVGQIFTGFIFGAGMGGGSIA